MQNDRVEDLEIKKSGDEKIWESRTTSDSRHSFVIELVLNGI